MCFFSFLGEENYVFMGDGLTVISGRHKPESANTSCGGDMFEFPSTTAADIEAK